MAAESIAFVAQSVQLYLTAAEPEGGKPRVDTRLESRNPLQFRMELLDVIFNICIQIYCIRVSSLKKCFYTTSFLTNSFLRAMMKL